MTILQTQNLKICIGQFVFLFLLSGCVSSLVSNTAVNFSESMTSAILNQSDPELVRDGAPSYLLLMDGLIESNPRDSGILSSAGVLYSMYASVFAEDLKRRSILTDRAKHYSSRALCMDYKPSCNWQGMPFDKYEETLNGLTKENSRAVYSYGFSWLAWIRAHSSDYKALTYLPYAEALLERYLDISNEVDQANIHIFLGILKSLLPSGLGGETELARKHFERAIELSQGNDLSAKVEFADTYAKLIYDRELHDSLLREVVNANPQKDGLTLTNILAQERAEEMLLMSDDYF